MPDRWILTVTAAKSKVLAKSWPLVDSISTANPNTRGDLLEFRGFRWFAWNSFRGLVSRPRSGAVRIFTKSEQSHEFGLLFRVQMCVQILGVISGNCWDSAGLRGAHSAASFRIRARALCAFSQRMSKLMNRAYCSNVNCASKYWG